MEKVEVIRRYQAGENVHTIASACGVNRKTVHKWLHAWGIPARNPKLSHTGRTRKVFSETEKAWIIKQFTEEGRLLKAIAAELVVWEGCVRRVLVEHGVRVKLFNPSPETIKQMARLYNEGCSLADFQETLGITRAGAVRILRNEGVKIRRRGKATLYGVKAGMKQCGRCHKYKAVEEFASNNTATDGVQAACRVCSGEMSTWGKLKRTRGLTQTTYAEMHTVQKGLCAICGQPETRTRLGKVCRLVVDHCHATSQIRGLLCASCNVALGHVRDNPKILKTMISYLEQNKKCQTATL